MANTKLGLVPFIETLQHELLEYRQKHQGDPGMLELENIEIDVCVDVSVDKDGQASISIAQPSEDAGNRPAQRLRMQFKSTGKAAKPADLTASVDVGLDSVSVGGPMYLDLDDILPGGHVFELPDEQQESLHKVWIIGGPSGSTEIDISDMAELSKSVKEHIGLDGQ